MNKHSVSHKIHGKQIFVKDRDEERQKKNKRTKYDIRTGASSVDANRAHSLSESLCPVYNFTLSAARFKPGKPFFFYLFCSDAVAVITHSPQRSFVFFVFFNWENLTWKIFFKTKWSVDNFAARWRKNRKKKAKNQIITGAIAEMGAQMVRHGI